MEGGGGSFPAHGSGEVGGVQVELVEFWRGTGEVVEVFGVLFVLVGLWCVSRETGEGHFCAERSQA